MMIKSILKIILFSFFVIIIIGIIFTFNLYLRKPNFFKSSLLVLKGSIYSERRLEDKAIEIYKKAENIDPDNPLIYGAIARSYARMEDWDNAIRYLKKSIEKAPEQERFYKVIFSIYMTKDAAGEAKEYFKKLLERDPSNKLVAKYLRLIQGYEIFRGHLKEKSREPRRR